MKQSIANRWLSDQFNFDPLRLSVSHRDPGFGQTAFDRTVKRSTANVFDPLTSNEPHFPQPRRNAVNAIDSQDSATLSGRKLVECHGEISKRQPNMLNSDNRCCERLSLAM
jgi:hypothetical protein